MAACLIAPKRCRSFVVRGTDVNLPIALRAGAASATIHPNLGGRLGQLDLGLGPVLRGPGPGLGWAEWGCYPLIPWSNRIPDGHLRFEEIDARLTVNWPDRSAIHGLVASCVWAVAASSMDRAELVVDAVARPYHVRSRQAFELEPARLRLYLSVENLGDAPVPVGLGIHPWFRAGPIRLPATLKWPGDPIPIGPPIPVDRSDDFRSARVAQLMDRCFTGLTDTFVEVPGVTLSWEGPITHIVVYSGAPGWVAVEPVTMANDGIGLADRGTPGHGVHVLEPTAQLSVMYCFERPSSTLAERLQMNERLHSTAYHFRGMEPPVNRGGSGRDLRHSLDRSIMDSLTSMHNRRYLETHLAPLVSQIVARG